jgi:hypothetical protein
MTIAKILDLLVAEEAREGFKGQIVELANAGDITVEGRLVRLGTTGHNPLEELIPIESAPAVIDPSELRVADWDWCSSKLSFETVSAELPEPRYEWYVDVSFVTTEIRELIEGDRPITSKPVRSAPGPKASQDWPSLLRIAQDLARNRSFSSQEAFFDEIREMANEAGCWAPKSNTSFKSGKNKADFVSLAREALRVSE